MPKIMIEGLGIVDTGEQNPAPWIRKKFESALERGIEIHYCVAVGTGKNQIKYGHSIVKRKREE